MGAAHGGEVALEVGAGDDHCAAAVVGMERQGVGLAQPFVEQEVHFAAGVVDEAKGRHTAGKQAQKALHALGRGKRKFAARGQALPEERGPERGFKMVDVEGEMGGKANQIVAIALVVAEKQVFAMHAPVVAPPAAGLFDGVAFGVVVKGEGDVMGVEVVDDNFFSGHSLGK